MWVANVIMLVVGTWLVLYVVMDLRATPPLRHRLWAWLKAQFGR
jgi:lipopolysaccharide export system permease protein